MGSKRVPEFLVLWLLGYALVGATCLSFPAMDGYRKHVHEECAFTRYPSLCVKILVGLDSGNQPTDFVSTLVGKAISEAKLTHSDLAKFSPQFGAQDAKFTDFVAGSYILLLLENLFSHTRNRATKQYST